MSNFWSFCLKRCRTTGCQCSGFPADLSPYQSALDCLKNQVWNSSLMNWIFTACGACKIQVWKRQKSSSSNLIFQTQIFKNQVQTDGGKTFGEPTGKPPSMVIFRRFLSQKRLRIWYPELFTFLQKNVSNPELGCSIIDGPNGTYQEWFW